MCSPGELQPVYNLQSEIANHCAIVKTKAGKTLTKTAVYQDNKGVLRCSLRSDFPRKEVTASMVKAFEVKWWTWASYGP